ncbi:MAG: hypothetical protein RPU13_13445 [Candidatus Sedimenticola sp. (ex Thyasira tokunagai)]
MNELSEFRKTLVIIQVSHPERVAEIAQAALKALAKLSKGGDVQRAFNSKKADVVGLLLYTEESPRVLVAELYRKAGLAKEDFAMATCLSEEKTRGSNVVESWLNMH